jgi:hypothetical protein
MVKKKCFYINFVIFFLSITIPSSFNLFNIFSPSSCWAQTDSVEEFPEIFSCDKAIKKLNNAVEKCIVADMDDINLLYDETGAGCLQRVLSDKNEEFFTKCYDLEKGATECRFDKILSAEDFIEKNQDRTKAYRILRERVLKAKCADFFNGCVSSKIEDAYKNQDVEKIAEIEKKYNYVFDDFENCSDYKNIRLIAREKKSAYYKDELTKILDGLQESGDLEALMKIRRVVTKYFDNCKDYLEMTENIKSKMCFFYQEWYEKTHEKIVEECDFKLLDLVDEFGFAQELGYCGEVDFQMESVSAKYNKNAVFTTKCKILLKCGQDQVKTIAGTCDPKQLQELSKVFNSCEGDEQAKLTVKKEVCGPLTDCFIEDLSAAADNCDFRHLKMIGNALSLLDDFKCNTKRKVEESFSTAKQEFQQKCLKRNIKIGESLCDFDRIIAIEQFLRLPFWEKLFKEFLQEINLTKENMGRDCLEKELDRLVFSCNYFPISRLGKYNQEGLMIYPAKEKMAELLSKARLKFCQRCLEEEIGAAFDSCQVETFFRWEKILEEEFSNIPQAEKVLEKVQIQKDLVFDHCFKQKILNAQQEVSIFQINDVEEEVDKHLSNLPNIKDYRSVISQAKDNIIESGGL